MGHSHLVERQVVSADQSRRRHIRRELEASGDAVASRLSLLARSSTAQPAPEMSSAVAPSPGSSAETRRSRTRALAPGGGMPPTCSAEDQQRIAQRLLGLLHRTLVTQWVAYGPSSFKPFRALVYAARTLNAAGEITPRRYRCAKRT